MEALPISTACTELGTNPFRIQCEVCDEPLSATRRCRQPYVGPCGHSFCGRCAYMLKGKCGRCRAVFHPVKNYALTDCLEKMEEIKQLLLVNKDVLQEIGVSIAKEDHDAHQEESEDGWDAVEKDWGEKSSDDDDDDDSVIYIPPLEFLHSNENGFWGGFLINVEPAFIGELAILERLRVDTQITANVQHHPDDRRHTTALEFYQNLGTDVDHTTNKTEPRRRRQRHYRYSHPTKKYSNPTTRKRMHNYQQPRKHY